MLKPFFLMLLALASFTGAVSSAGAQDIFQKVIVTGTVYAENGLGKLSTTALSNKVVMQLCGITANFSQYDVVLGVTDAGGDTLRFGIFVVELDGAVQKAFMEFRNDLQADDGTDGVSIGNSKDSRALLKVVAVLENTKSAGALLLSTGDKKVPLQILAEVNDENSPKFILKAKVVIKGRFSAVPGQPQ